MRAYDAVVVGSGAAGGWAAKELCEGGLEVLLLEAGPELDSAADFPLPAPAERRLASRLAALARGQHVQMRCAVFNTRTRRFFVDDRRHRYTTPAGRSFNWFRGRQVGGRLHVWARVMLRMSPADLTRWPLAHEDLAPCYDDVEEFLGVHAASLTGAEARLATALAGTADVAAVRLAEADQGPMPKTLRAAAATGRLTLRADSVVRQVILDGAAKATGVEYADRGTRQVHRAQARVVVLCAGAIETLRILLHSGVGNSSGRLGRFVMDHVMTTVGGPDEGGTEPGAGHPYDFGSATGFSIPRGDFGVQGGVGRGGGSWYMLAHGRMLARGENRVTLHPRTTDAWGVPVARIDCAHSPVDSALAARQLRTMRELAAGAGLTVRTPPSGRPLESLAFRLARRHLVLPSGAFVPGSAAHEIGGAGMGEDPMTSVTDPWGRLWDADNVVVADGACFPSGLWQNVTLTIMALAVRASRRVTRDFRDGRL